MASDPFGEEDLVHETCVARGLRHRPFRVIGECVSGPGFAGAGSVPISSRVSAWPAALTATA